MFNYLSMLLLYCDNDPPVPVVLQRSLFHFHFNIRLIILIELDLGLFINHVQEELDSKVQSVII